MLVPMTSELPGAFAAGMPSELPGLEKRRKPQFGAFAAGMPPAASRFKSGAHEMFKTGKTTSSIIAGETGNGAANVGVPIEMLKGAQGGLGRAAERAMKWAAGAYV